MSSTPDDDVPKTQFTTPLSSDRVDELSRSLVKHISAGTPAPIPRVGVCVICKGKITETYYSSFNASTGPLVLGPGSKNQFHWVSNGLSCDNCGVKYAKLPPEK